VGRIGLAWNQILLELDEWHKLQQLAMAPKNAL